MEFKEALKQFIRENLIDEGEVSDLADDEQLIKRGIIDSMGVLQIMTFIEEEAGTRVPDSEVLLENFESVARIDEMVQRLTAKTS